MADKPRDTSDILVMTVDQKGVVMQKEDLRPATRKAAEEAPRQPGTRLSPGEKINRKHRASVAAVYDIKTHERSPEMIKIRSLRSSGDFDAYWKFHRTREHQRNHSSAGTLAKAA